MILGISGSPRPNKITEKAVKKVLAEVDGETKYISLAGKQISGCISCLGCIKINKCVLKDDFQAISEDIVKAKAIVIGAPNYYNVPNGLTHCLLERCFCFRHQGGFLLKNKPTVVISTGYSPDAENNPVLKIVEYFLQSNKMNILSKYLVNGYSQCYECGAGQTCADGNVVKTHGFVDAITQDMLPLDFDEQPESIEKCKNAAVLINKALTG